MGIAQRTADALTRVSSEKDSSVGLAQAANMCTIAAGLVSFPTGGGAVAAAAAFTMLAGATAEANRQSEEKSESKATIGGSCVEAIIDSMQTALRSYEDNHQAVEKRLAAAMREYIHEIAAHSSPEKGLVVKAPNALADPPPSGEDRGDEFVPNSMAPFLK